MRIWSRKVFWNLATSNTIIQKPVIEQKMSTISMAFHTYGAITVADRVGFEPTSLLRDYLISSQGRYDHFDTCPCSIFILPASPKKCKKVGKKERAGQKSDSTKSPKFRAFFKNETARFVTTSRPFRVRAVMTTSIPVRIQLVLRYYIGSARKKQGKLSSF